jgi:hypothetical protein
LFTDLLSIVRFDSAIFVVAEENTRLQSKLGWTPLIRRVDFVKTVDFKTLKCPYAFCAGFLLSLVQFLLELSTVAIMALHVVVMK